MYGDVGREGVLPEAKELACTELKSDICRDIRFSERELWTERAE